MHRRTFVTSGLAGIGALALPQNTISMKTDTRSEDKTWAVLYGSKCGSTKKVAEWINEGMGGIADVIDVDDDPDITSYEYIVIGGWIQAGNLVRNVKDFITENLDDLKPKLMGLFTVCGNGGNKVGATETDNYLTKQIVKISGVSDKPAQLFNGKSDPACNNLSFTYDLLDQNAGVAFGNSILSTALQNVRHQSAGRFALDQARYNPHRPLTPIRYSIPVSCTVTISVCSLDGSTITALVSQRQQAGSHMTYWDTGRLSSGIYLYRLDAAGFTATRTLHIAR